MEPSPPSQLPQCLSGRESVDFELLLLIEQEPGLSQRELAKRLGISLGRINYCLKGLADKGWLKLDNFANAPKKLVYAYALTPSGLAHRSRLTTQFLKRKLIEYERLRSQIELLKRELPPQ